MRYLMKGGYWKNSEDEILKAAVMKYGLNQWSRISSLIARKSAKQCKARWYEWLDPSIKKTEWTREEEEKLLHQAKIFPSQWRSIAPQVGRTPAQCVEHYEALQDRAQGRDEMDENDPRRLKPGEIDPTPEIRPARADAKDMDDDEKEMIAEGRVRLANIKGKKAKRRAREKVIEESRRQAQLQKQRELKAAGIDFQIERRKKKKKKEMDYNVEIPFEHRPVDLVYQTGPEENPDVNPNITNISLNSQEGPRRDAEEKNKRKQDQRTIKKLKKLDLPSTVAKMNRNNPLFYENLGALKMNEPQLSDKELQLLGKMTKMNLEMQTSLSQDVTKNLVGNYSICEPTPVRTPKFGDSQMRDAMQAMALHNVESPMVGGESSIYLDGIGDKRAKSSTPNPYKNVQLSRTPDHLMNGGLTPLSYANRTPLGLQDPSRTPGSLTGSHQKRSLIGQQKANQTYFQEYNDELRLNNDEWTDSNWENTSMYSGLATSNREKSKEDRNVIIREMIKKAQMDLPEPRNDYEIEVPSIESIQEKIDEEKLKDNRVKDQAEEDEIKQRNLESEREITKKLKTLSAQNNQPKIRNLLKEDYVKSTLSYKNVKDLIEKEKIRLMVKDSWAYQQQDKSHNGISNDINKYFFDIKKIEMEENIPDNFEIEELEKAEFLIYEERKQIIKEEGYLDEDQMRNHLFENWGENWDKYRDKRRRNFHKKFEADKRNLDQDLKDMGDKLEHNKKLAETIEELEKNLEGNADNKNKQELMVIGYGELLEELEKKEIDLETFSELKVNEDRAGFIRQHELDINLSKLKDKESQLQNIYSGLSQDIKDLVEESNGTKLANGSADHSDDED